MFSVLWDLDCCYFDYIAYFKMILYVSLWKPLGFEIKLLM